MKKIPFAKPIITEDMIEAGIYALKNEKLVMGESIYKFEEDFSRYVGTKYAVSVNSGTSALIIGYMALGVTKKKFIAPSATFISTVSSGLIAGGKVILSDINLNNYTIKTENLQILLKKHKGVKVITPVHLYGFPAQMDILVDLAEEHGVAILEDAAQAHGAIYKGRKVGTWGDVGIFSFYPIKNMTVGGDGGILVTNNEEIAEFAKKIRDCGRRSKYIHDEIGFVFRLNTINAAIGRVQLKYLDYWNRKRIEIAKTYYKLLSDIDEIILPPLPSRDIVPVYHLYVIRLKNTSVRNALGAWLVENGVEVLIHYPVPVHKQPIFSKYDDLLINTEGTELSASELWAKTILSLPMHPELKKNEIEYISDAIHKFFAKKIYEQKEWIRKGELWLKKYM